MAELSTADNWTLSQLMTAVEKFTFADGKADINETRALIGLVHPDALDVLAKHLQSHVKGFLTVETDKVDVGVKGLCHFQLIDYIKDI